MVQESMQCSKSVWRDAVGGGKGVSLVGWGPERDSGRDGPEAPGEMPAQHGSSLPGLGVRERKE